MCAAAGRLVCSITLAGMDVKGGGKAAVIGAPCTAARRPLTSAPGGVIRACVRQNRWTAVRGSRSSPRHGVHKCRRGAERFHYGREFCALYFYCSFRHNLCSVGNDFIITYGEVIRAKNWKRYKISWDIIENVSICRRGITTYVYEFKMSDEAKTILPTHFRPAIYATHATRKIIESNMPIHNGV